MQDFIELLFSGKEIPYESKILKRNEFLINSGDIESHLFWVETGALRVFYISEIEECTIRFGYKNSIITSLYSLLKNTPSEFFIQAIRKTTVRIITKENFKKIVSKSPEHILLYQKLLESFVTQQIEREIDLLTHSPIDRLHRVQERSPQLFQEIPSKYIASYLRMTPETLSRIRNS